MPQRIVAFLLCIVVTGCGSKYDLVPAKGRVTLNGKPVAGAIVTQPIGKDTTSPGPGSGAVLGPDGEFELSLQIDETMKGAVVGEHRIRINEAVETQASNDDSAGRVRHKIPEEYRDGTFTFTIPPEGTDQMIIEIVTKKR